MPTPEAVHMPDGRCCVGAAFVNRDLLGHAVQVDGAFEEAPRGSEITVRAQQQVRRVAGAVHRPEQVLPLH